MILYSEYDVNAVQKIAQQEIKNGADKRVWLSNILDAALMGTLEYLQKAKIIDKVILNEDTFFDTIHTKAEIKEFCKEFTK